MRIRLPLGRSLFVLCALAFSLVALLPLRLAAGWLGLDTRGIMAREAEGSLWLGRLVEAQAGGFALGNLSTRLATWPLLAGRARIEFAREDETRPLTGAITISRHSFGADDLSGGIETAGAATPLPLASLDLDRLSFRFQNGQCAAASGSIRATAAGELGLLVPGGLAGGARCEAGALLLPLASPAGGERLMLRMFGDGRYMAELTVRAPDVAVRDRLVAAGFAATADGFRLIRSGSF